MPHKSFRLKVLVQNVVKIKLTLCGYKNKEKILHEMKNGGL
jgi:hypothetical protein